MRRVWTVLCLAVVASCNKGPAGGGEPGGPVSEPSGPIASGRAAADNAVTGGEAIAVQAGDLPAPGPTPRFIGNWAADQKSCQSAAWRFTDSTLKAPAGESCSFNRVTPADGGYDIEATCTVKGAPEAETLTIRFAESAKAMLFSSKTMKDTGLIFCGRDV